MKRYWCAAVGIFLVAVLSDQMTKLWALNALSNGEHITLIPGALSLHLTFNPGAAFSFLENSTWVFTIVSIVAIIAMAWGVLKTRSLMVGGTLALLAGGALGNLIDRLVQPPAFGVGHVIDFINYGGFFVGNVADIWIVVAAGLLMLLAVKGYELTGKAPSDSRLSDSVASGDEHV